MRKILVIYYSQSGQLKDIADHVSRPLELSPDTQVFKYEIQPKEKFPFPWSGEDFFNAFPETFQQIPIEIESPPQEILDQKFDLILFHYQVWYLSPSIPINSFLKSEYAKKILDNTPIVTISGSRNMWVFAQDKVKKLLESSGGKLVGNIALTDRHINLVSVITIVDWMFHGKKRKAYGVLPLPGVSQEEIDDSVKFGDIIHRHLISDDYASLQEELVQRNAIEYRFFLVSMDKKGNKMFQIWSKLILKNPEKRKTLLQFFKIYLFCAIWILSPIVHIIEILLYPFRYYWIHKEKKRIQSL